MIAALLIAAAMLFQMGLLAVLVWAIARWLRAEKATLAGGLVIALLYVAIVAAMIVVLGLVSATGELFVVVVVGLLLLLLPAGVIHRMMHLSWGRSLACYVLALAGITVSYALFIPLRLYVVESFQSPSNGLSPTLIGHHYVGVCPHCEGTLIVPRDESDAQSEQRWFEAERERRAICSGCRRRSRVTQLPEAIGVADRFCVEKFRFPQRFELAVFCGHENRAERFVSRVVALPGETVAIRADGIWIDNERIPLPADMEGLSFDLDGDAWQPPYATEDDPLKLGDDEFFVLGDFAGVSKDSRFDGPVRRDAICGVVTLIYWPPHRARILK